MYKIIGGDKNEYGPVSIEEMQLWISQNRVNARTMVKKEGTDEWKPLGNHPELAALLGGKPPPAASVPPADLAALKTAILERPVRVEIGSCISRAWNLCKENLMMVVGCFFLVFLSIGIAGADPIIGSLISTVLNGVMLGGLYWVYLRLIRGEPAEVGDAFAGFSRGFVNLMLAGIVTSFLTMIPAFVVMLPFFIPMILVLVHGGNMDAAVAGSVVFIVLGVIAGLVVMIALSLMWWFTFALVIDKQIGFWDAMELSRKTVSRAPGQFLGLVLMCGLVGASGILVCCVGVFVTAPLSFIGMLYAYEDNFGNRTSQNVG